MIVTTVGSYPKVATGGYSTTLIRAITKRQREELTEAQLEETYRMITRAVIREQDRAGVDLLTDGQIRWEDLVTPIARRLDGFEINGLARWFNNNAYYRRPVLRRKPVRRAAMLVSEYRFAKSCTSKPVKAVLPAPYTFAMVSEDRVYKRTRAFTFKMAEILNEEARALADAGASVVQFDDPAYGFGKTDVKLAVEALGIAARGVRAKTAVSTYFGALEGALEPLLRAKVDIIGIDVVSSPASLKALARARVTREVALGCMDARSTKLESVRELHAIFRAAERAVPSERLYVNPNCGLEFLPHPQALAKIRRLAEAARTFRRRAG